MGKKTDYDGIINFYHILSKSRPLQPHEEERLIEIIEKQKTAIVQTRYRARNREHLIQKRIEYAKKNPEKQAANARRYRANNPEKARDSCAAWRAKNPERVKELSDARNAKRKAEREANSQSSSGSTNLL
jgi:hypothetical protein